MSSNYECNDIKDIAKCFQQLHSHIDSEIAGLKAKQAETDKRMDVFQNQVEYATGELKDIYESHIPSLEELIEREQNERLKLELWGRKWNLIVRGVSGTEKEHPSKTLAMVKVFMNTKLYLNETRVGQMPIAAVHRLPSGPETKRNIILRLVNLIDRDAILSAAKNLGQGSGYSVVPDLPPSLATRRGELLKERSEMSEQDKKKCRLVYLKDPPFLKLVMKPQ